MTDGCRTRPRLPRTIAAVTVLAGLYRSEKEHYEAAPDAATEIACKPLGPAPEGQDVATLAAWTVVGNALMNTDEFVTKR